MYKCVLIALFSLNVSYASVKYVGTENNKFTSLDNYTCMYLNLTEEDDYAQDLDPIKKGYVVRKRPSDVAPIVAGVVDSFIGADLRTETKNGYVSVVAIPEPLTSEPYVKGWMKRNLLTSYDDHMKEMDMHDGSYCKVIVVLGGQIDDNNGRAYMDFNFYRPEKPAK